VPDAASAAPPSLQSNSMCAAASHSKPKACFNILRVSQPPTTGLTVRGCLSRGPFASMSCQGCRVRGPVAAGAASRPCGAGNLRTLCWSHPLSCEAGATLHERLRGGRRVQAPHPAEKWARSLPGAIKFDSTLFRYRMFPRAELEARRIGHTQFHACPL